MTMNNPIEFKKELALQCNYCQEYFVHNGKLIAGNEPEQASHNGQPILIYTNIYGVRCPNCGQAIILDRLIVKQGETRDMKPKLVRWLTHQEVIELYAYKGYDKWRMKSFYEQPNLMELLDSHPPGTCEHCWQPNDWSTMYPNDLTDDDMCNDCVGLEEEAQMSTDWSTGTGYL